MLRVSMANKDQKSTFRPLYANTQATPLDVLLDPAWDSSVDIYPGMALMKTTGKMATLLNGTGVPLGHAGFFEAPKIGMTMVTNQGVNAAVCWVLGPDAQFEVLAPAFDTAVPWVDPGNGTFQLITAYTSGPKRGQLCPVGTTDATNNPSTTSIARLISVVSAQKIIIGGLQGRAA